MLNVKFLTEKRLLTGFYAFWLCLSVWFVFHYEISDFFWLHLFYIGLVPLIGLWFLYWKRDINYIFAGILVMYLVQQIYYGRYVWAVYQHMH